MNREDIIRMAREAGCKPFRSPEHWDDVQVFATPDVLERFAALVAAAAKAEENEELRQRLVRMAALYEKAANDRDALFEKYVASAIRARGKQ